MVEALKFVIEKEQVAPLWIAEYLEFHCKGLF